MFFDNLPKTVIIGGTEYEINSDFRTSIKFEKLLFDSEISKEEALLKGIELYYPKRPHDEKEALERIIWFYMCGEDPKPNGNKEKRLYSIEYDFKYIYSAFLEQYSLDLFEVDMHWWKFQALFTSLNDCMFQKIVGYRAVDVKKLPVDERKRYRKLQEIFALPNNDSKNRPDEIKFQKGLEESLLNGDVSEFLKENKYETD